METVLSLSDMIDFINFHSFEKVNKLTLNIPLWANIIFKGAVPFIFHPKCHRNQYTSGDIVNMNIKCMLV